MVTATSLQRSKNLYILAQITLDVAQHQHALVRYVTLDRCLSKFSMNKAELIGRCSDAVNRVTGNDRRLSEKTFFNDIRALREGVVLGREAEISCVQGFYRYSEHGFSLFHAGEEKQELLIVQQDLARLQERARSAWECIQYMDIDSTRLKAIRALLLDDEVATWARITERDEVRFRTNLKLREPRQQVGPAAVSEPLAEYVPKDLPTVMEQRAPKPPQGLSPDELARWYLLEQRSSFDTPSLSWRKRWRMRQEFGRVLSVLRDIGLG